MYKPFLDHFVDDDCVWWAVCLLALRHTLCLCPELAAIEKPVRLCVLAKYFLGSKDSDFRVISIREQLSRPVRLFRVRAKLVALGECFL